MSNDQKRDADMDRLLRAVLKPPPPEAVGACPEADVLAAFSEGGLTATEQSALDAHIAGCGRCQEALAILSHELPHDQVGEAPAPQASTWFTWVTQPRLRWLVPISAVATVAVVFFATRPLIAPEGEVPRTEVARMAQAPVTPAPPSEGGASALLEKSAPVPEKDERAAAPGAPPAPGVPARDKRTAAPVADTMAARVASEEKAAAPPAAPVAGASAMRAQKMEMPLLTVSAPGGSVIWRFGAGGRLARSADAGDTWHDQVSGVSADLVAGAAPTPAVCWIVGTAGTVLFTADGERWERLPFPEAVDLVAVTAASARTATVTTRDGRRFETRDAGLTWSPKR